MLNSKKKTYVVRWAYETVFFHIHSPKILYWIYQIRTELLQPELKTEEYCGYTVCFFFIVFFIENKIAGFENTGTPKNSLKFGMKIKNDNMK